MSEVGWADVPILAVETSGADSFAAAVAAGRLVTLPAITSIATTLGARTVAGEALAWARRREIIPWVVSDGDAVGACLRFADDHRVYQGIAWGVMNRVRLSEISATARRQYGGGVAGVIFKPQQFNPAVSLRSPFSKDFLCPQDPTRWRLAVEAARAALRGQDNPFIQTPWERRHGRSLVVNFYYPHSSQARGPLAPWEGSRALRFIGNPSSGNLPPAERIRFYRLAQPPGDLRDPAD